MSETLSGKVLTAFSELAERTDEGFIVSGYLQDEVVAITGSGRGIGRSIALLAAAKQTPNA